jgi:hypothetical protein
MILSLLLCTIRIAFAPVDVCCLYGMGGCGAATATLVVRNAHIKEYPKPPSGLWERVTRMAATVCRLPAISTEFIRGPSPVQEGEVIERYQPKTFSPSYGPNVQDSNLTILSKDERLLKVISDKKGLWRKWKNYFLGVKQKDPAALSHLKTMRQCYINQILGRYDDDGKDLSIFVKEIENKKDMVQLILIRGREAKKLEVEIVPFVPRQGTMFELVIFLIPDEEKFTLEVNFDGDMEYKKKNRKASHS